MSVMGDTPDGGAPAAPTGDSEKVAEVQAVLEKVRPFLAADGGDIQLLSVEDDWVTVRLQGACMGCAAAAQTLFQGIEPQLRAACSWVKGVRAG